MPTPIRKDDGRFNGSVGDGAKHTPTAPPAAAGPAGYLFDEPPALLAITDLDRDFAALDPHLHQQYLDALNPDTDPDTLTELARHPEPELVALVAQHPNLPGYAVADLIFHGDDTVVDHALQHPNLPTHALFDAFTDRERSAIYGPAWHRVTSGQGPTFADLADFGREVGRLDDLASAETLDDGQTAHLIENEPGAWCTLAQRWDLDGDQYEDLYDAANRSDHTASFDTICDLAGNDNIGYPLAERIFVDHGASPAVALPFAQRDDIHPDHYAALTTSTSYEVREAFARNRDVPLTVRLPLAQDASWSVRQAFSAEPDLPRHLLEAYTADEHPSVRAIVATNPNLPEQLADRLAGDPEVAVRLNVAAHPRLTLTALDRLAVDPDPVVRTAAKQHPYYGDLPEGTLVEAALLDL